jgi:glycosyltransferase involved in cell wall biosynthesis
MSRIWFDVGDLFGYAGHFRRPSGVQRVVFELGAAIAALDPAGARSGFVRYQRGDFVPVGWADIEALLATMNDDAPPAPSAARLQIQALQALLSVPRAFLPHRHHLPSADGMQPGDVMVIAGAGWSDSDHVARVSAARARLKIRVALLVYDIIPVLRPEWFDPLQGKRFRIWLDGMLAVSDRLLAISAATADDVVRYRARLGLMVAPIPVIRLGDGFSHQAASVQTNTIAGPYALFVSTVEIRKNHSLLVEAWRRLLSRLGPEAVPRLVFAGRPGGLSGDLMRVLRQSNFLDGHVILRADAGDAEMAALYRGCDFTLFPSLYEGWGLPVAESLCFGKPCFASSASSVPEVGGDLVRYFDPLDPDDVVAQISAVLADPRDLAGWAARIGISYRPQPWLWTAQMVMDGVA